MPRLILLLLFFWLSVSTIFFSVGTPSFDNVKRLSWLDDKQYILLTLSGWTAKVLRSFSEGTLTCDTLLSDNLHKRWMFITVNRSWKSQTNEHTGLLSNKIIPWTVTQQSLHKIFLSFNILSCVYGRTGCGFIVTMSASFGFATFTHSVLHNHLQHWVQGMFFSLNTSAFYDLSAFSTFLIF